MWFRKSKRLGTHLVEFLEFISDYIDIDGGGYRLDMKE